MFKKFGIGLLGVTIVAVGLIWYQKQANAVPLPEKNGGTAQVLINKTDQPKAIKITQTGYYDVETVSGTEDIVAIGAPRVGQTVVGEYFEKGDTLTLEVAGEIRLAPAKLAIFSGDKIKLDNYGTYYVGSQIPAGTYQVTYEGELTDAGLKDGETGSISFNVRQLGAADDQMNSIKLTQKIRKKELTVKKNDTLTLKSNSNVSVLLSRVK